MLPVGVGVSWVSLETGNKSIMAKCYVISQTPISVMVVLLWFCYQYAADNDWMCINFNVISCYSLQLIKYETGCVQVVKYYCDH